MLRSGDDSVSNEDNNIITTAEKKMPAMFKISDVKVEESPKFQQEITTPKLQFPVV